jgi:TPR repeat protein
MIQTISSTVLKCLFFIFLFVMAGQRAVASDSLKSIVLKDRFTDRDFFYLKRDNSLDEMWDAFMVMKKANSGDPVAEHELGLRYLIGKDFAADTQRAALWIGKAAKQNLIPAKYNYGILLNNGCGTDWNPFDAYRNFQYAALRGMPEAEYVYGLLLTDNLIVTRNNSEAYRWLSMAADSGYEPAKEVLTEFKVRGIKITPDSEKVSSTGSHKKIDSTNSAVIASTALPAAQPVFIDFSSMSSSVPDTKTLIRDALIERNIKLDSTENHISSIFRDTILDSKTLQSVYKSAEHGSPEALTLIGRLYERGIGVDKDRFLASLYYIRAVRFGSPWAPMLLWDLTRKEDYFPLLKKHVDANEPAALFTWAELGMYGFDHQLTESQSIDFLKQSAANDFPEALVTLAMYLYNGSKVLKDQEKAIELLNLARQLGNHEAKIRLYMIELMTEKQISVDSSRFKSIQELADNGSILADMLLGYCYRNGKDVAVNLPEAVRLYRKATRRGSNIAYDALRNMYDEIRPKDFEFQIEER